MSQKLRAGEQVEVWPSHVRRQELAARRVQSGNRTALRQHHAQGRLVRHLRAKPYKRRPALQWYENLPPPREPGEPIGHIDAIDPLTGKQKWRVPIMDIPIWSAMLATAGGLLFTGTETGEFIALDIDNGKTLWQFQTGSGINAQPITYTYKGRQYVTVLSGIGGRESERGCGSSSRTCPRGGSVWTFALMPE